MPQLSENPHEFLFTPNLIEGEIRIDLQDHFQLQGNWSAWLSTLKLPFKGLRITSENQHQFRIHLIYSGTPYVVHPDIGTYTSTEAICENTVAQLNRHFQHIYKRYLPLVSGTATSLPENADQEKYTVADFTETNGEELTEIRATNSKCTAVNATFRKDTQQFVFSSFFQQGSRVAQDVLEKWTESDIKHINSTRLVLPTITFSRYMASILGFESLVAYNPLDTNMQATSAKCVIFELGSTQPPSLLPEQFQTLLLKSNLVMPTIVNSTREQLLAWCTYDAANRSFELSTQFVPRRVALSSFNHIIIDISTIIEADSFDAHEALFNTVTKTQLTLQFQYDGDDNRA